MQSMPTSSDTKKLRDASGRFVKSGTKIEDTAVKSNKITGAGLVLSEMSEEIELEKPLLSFQINNPLKRLLYWIKQIKQKQTTTFEFKVKVPLIALPVFLIVLGSAFTFFFSLGKNSQETGDSQQSEISILSPITPTPTPSPYIMTKVGVLKASYQVLGLSIVKKAYAVDEESIPTSTPTIVPTNTPIPTPTLTPTPTPVTYRWVLLDKEEKITIILNHTYLKLDNYVNKRVVITGLYDPQQNVLTLKKEKDIEILP